MGAKTPLSKKARTAENEPAAGELVGGRFSRVRITQKKLDTRESIAEHLRRPGALEEFARIAREAAEFLQQKGLPSAILVVWREGAKEPVPISECPPAERDPSRVRYLEHYVINDLGFERDSPQGLAARIIAKHQELQATPKLETKLGCAFQLGELVTLRNSYAIDSWPRRQPRNSKPAWVLDAVAYLIAEAPKASAQKLWRNIPESTPGGEKGLELFRWGRVYRDGDKLCCSNSDRAIGYESFRKYVKNAQKAAGEEKKRAPVRKLGR